MIQFFPKTDTMVHWCRALPRAIRTTGRTVQIDGYTQKSTVVPTMTASKTNARGPVPIATGEDGLALIWVIFTLAIVTAIGFSAINMATLDTYIRQAENERISAFYLTDAAARAAAQELENDNTTTDINTGGSVSFFAKDKKSEDTVSLTDNDEWLADGVWDDTVTGVPQALSGDSNDNLSMFISYGRNDAGLRVAAQHVSVLGVDDDDSIVMTSAGGRKYAYYIYALHDNQMAGMESQGSTMIQIGYTKKF
jgi:hypothetical protein